MLVDQPVVLRTVELTLNHGAFLTRAVSNSQAADDLIDRWPPHLAVIDMDLSGDEVLRRLARLQSWRHTYLPVIALTRRGDLKTKLEAFDLGVDDIMTVPFSPEELLARALVIVRRTYGEPLPVQPVIRLGEIEIDIVNRVVRAGESELHLTGLEQSLLYLLAANAGTVLTREEIIDALWGNDYVVESNIVDRHIRGLRVKLQNDWRRPRFIATVPGKGYSFIPTFTAQDPASAGERAGDR